MQSGGARSVERKYDWKQPNRRLVAQTGVSVDQAKVFKAHAVPQGTCGNVIHALKLLRTNKRMETASCRTS